MRGYQLFLGIALVADKKRVPKPATGNTPLVTLFMIRLN
jgi:hypothetical protein